MNTYIYILEPNQCLIFRANADTDIFSNDPSNMIIKCLTKPNFIVKIGIIALKQYTLMGIFKAFFLHNNQCMLGNIYTNTNKTYIYDGTIFGQPIFWSGSNIFSMFQAVSQIFTF